MLDDAALERSPVVANNLMNRERTLASYARELGIDVLAEVGAGRWLDLCCGTARALTEAAAVLPKGAEIVGVDLVDPFVSDPLPAPSRLITASVATWEPDGPSDLITCVHGLHYVGDKLGLLTRAASWLTENGLLIANFDTRSVRHPDGTPPGRRLTTALRQAGFAYDPRRHRISLRGHQKVELPYHYLGADDRAGPNYTGQPAVNSIYTHMK
ncbi:methyltransferase domain-containing protein [Actinomadura sp. KC06]|uniref:class I SAM-dependent methyltransferase n=1 Tax=Actinomadura sp. KC06 TaxID=2530369 RepID=UPI0010433C9D|nr:class I SAM-dependent methyltransferase [Actinomadura sp. KC06]TDD25425.1 methyltransferase domain-containing protein [Actinomadura sp. KC06]